ncbi:MAG: hypothetical protein JNL81_01515 [Hyphomonadaceae bacterium]|nr:hypothetical protein [Hyphomonadaceae bacterium]
MNRAARFIARNVSRLLSLSPVSAPVEKKDAQPLINTAPEAPASNARRDAFRMKVMIVSRAPLAA